MSRFPELALDTTGACPDCRYCDCAPRHLADALEIALLKQRLGAADRGSGQRDAATPQELRIPAEEIAHDAPVGVANPSPDASSRESAGQRRELLSLVCRQCGRLTAGVRLGGAFIPPPCGHNDFLVVLVACELIHD